MRQVERQMLGHIKARKNFKLGNTEVTVTDRSIYVFLHDNCITEIHFKDNTMEFHCRADCTGGSMSRTTASRLNALLTLSQTNACVYMLKGVEHAVFGEVAGPISNDTWLTVPIINLNRGDTE